MLRRRPRLAIARARQHEVAIGDLFLTLVVLRFTQSQTVRGPSKATQFTVVSFRSRRESPNLSGIFIASTRRSFSGHRETASAACITAAAPTHGGNQKPKAAVHFLNALFGFLLLISTKRPGLVERPRPLRQSPRSCAKKIRCCPPVAGVVVKKLSVPGRHSHHVAPSRSMIETDCEIVRVPPRACWPNAQHPWNGNYLAVSLDHGATWSHVVRMTSGVLTTHYTAIEETTKDNRIFFAHDLGDWSTGRGRSTHGRFVEIAVKSK